MVSAPHTSLFVRGITTEIGPTNSEVSEPHTA